MRVIVILALFVTFALSAINVVVNSPLALASNLVSHGACLICVILLSQK